MIAQRPKEEEREERIVMEIVVDAYDPEEQAMGWYCYLDDILTFSYYTEANGRAPTEADMQRCFGTTPPTVQQMILRLDSLGFISRIPGQARSIRVQVPQQTLPALVKP